MVPWSHLSQPLLACLVVLVSWFAAPLTRAGEPVFATDSGLTPSGEVVARWANEARLHGIDVAGLLAATWRDGQSAGADGAARPVPVEDSVQRERALRQQLEILVAELPPRPREDGVVKVEGTSYYASPDVFWLGAPRRTASPEAVDAALEAAREGHLDAHLASLLPHHPQYARLVAAAKRYEAMCQAGGFPRVERPPNKRGQPGRAKFKAPTGELAVALEARLAAEGFLTQEQVTGHWNVDAQAAWSRWLTSRQLPQPRGLLLDDFYAALNVPCEALVATLALNAKRWRHAAWRGETTFIEVNIAGQELRYVRDGELVMTQRTVVGATLWYRDKELDRRLNVRSTPVMAHAISRIVINPTWAVPPRIAQRTIEKELAKDPDYLAKKKIRLVTSARGKTYIQDPGADNALGLIKLLFPNDESIYLHDTPKKAAFKLAVRAQSNGCVRVENALDLGLHLLESDAHKSGAPFSKEKLRARAGHGGSIIFDLAEPVPVFLDYFTASVDDAGAVRFHVDIYAYDAEVAR